MEFFKKHKYFITGLLVVVVVALTLPLVVPQPFAMIGSMLFGAFAGRTAARLKHESNKNG